MSAYGFDLKFTRCMALAGFDHSYMHAASLFCNSTTIYSTLIAKVTMASVLDPTHSFPHPRQLAKICAFIGMHLHTSIMTCISRSIISGTGNKHLRGPVFVKKSSAASTRGVSFKPPPSIQGKVDRIHASSVDTFALFFFARLTAL